VGKTKRGGHTGEPGREPARVIRCRREEGRKERRSNGKEPTGRTDVQEGGTSELTEDKFKLEVVGGKRKREHTKKGQADGNGR